MSEIHSKIEFVLELEKLKAVLRKTRPHGMERFENSAEHSWQTTMAALIFMPEDLDALRVLKMLLIHDIVEIDAGDVFVYDEAARKAAEEIEAIAAERIFGLLPHPLGEELLALWREFEDRASPEAVYAKAVDRMCPVIQNISRAENSWTEHGLTKEQVIAKNEEIGSVQAELWAVLRDGIERRMA